MSIEKVRDFFGIKYLIPYDIDSRKPLCVLRAIGEISYENEIEAVELLGGHVDAPHDVEYSQPSPTLSGVLREYPAELFDLLESATITENAAEAAGAIDASPTNGQGTSIFRTPGITGVTISTAANLKFGRYVFVATGAQTLDLHIAGLSTEFLDIDGLVISGISTTTTGSVAVTAAGITLTIAGTPAYTIGDTFYFDVRPINTGSTEIIVGSGTAPNEFGLMCVFPQKGDGVLHLIDVFRVSARGIPWKAVSREFSEFNFGWKPLARPSDGAVYQMIRVLGET